MSARKTVTNTLTALALTAALTTTFTGAALPQTQPDIAAQTTQTADTMAHLTTLKNGDLAARQHSAEQLGKIALSGQSVPIILPALITLTRDADATLRQTATNYIGAIGTTQRSHSTPALRALSLLAGDTDPLVRARAATGIGTIGTAHASTANAALRALGEILARHDNHGSILTAAIDHAGAIGTAHMMHAGAALQLLAQHNRHRDAEVRLHVVHGMLQIGITHNRHAHTSINNLTVLATDPVPAIHEAAQRAITEISKIHHIPQAPSRAP